MDQMLSWLMLKLTPGIGNVLIKRLLDHFRSPAHVLGASAEQLARIGGVSLKLAGHILRQQHMDQVKRELHLIQKNNCRMIRLTDPTYPPLLREIPDPPPYLYTRGLLLDTERSISVVGSRSATTYGISVARQLSQAFSKSGYTVISGLARGIDTAAHKGALSGGGRTLAVLGSGLLRIYPKENRNLARLIVENGAVISEFPLLAAPEAYHFPARNRIISGISRGTIVVEAARKSGSLITARLALEQNREVFAVPGNIKSFKSSGTHALIKQGAKLVETAQDVFEELEPMMASPGETVHQPHSPESPHRKGLSPEETRIVKALSPYPIHMDELARQLSIPVGILAGALLKLELCGLIQQTSENFFSLTSTTH